MKKLVNDNYRFNSHLDALYQSLNAMGYERIHLNKDDDKPKDCIRIQTNNPNCGVYVSYKYSTYYTDQGYYTDIDPDHTNHASFVLIHVACLRMNLRCVSSLNELTYQNFDKWANTIFYIRKYEKNVELPHHFLCDRTIFIPKQKGIKIPAIECPKMDIIIEPHGNRLYTEEWMHPIGITNVARLLLHSNGIHKNH